MNWRWKWLWIDWRLMFPGCLNHLYRFNGSTRGCVRSPSSWKRNTERHKKLLLGLSRSQREANYNSITPFQHVTIHTAAPGTSPSSTLFFKQTAPTSTNIICNCVFSLNRPKFIVIYIFFYRHFDQSRSSLNSAASSTQLLQITLLISFFFHFERLSLLQTVAKGLELNIKINL